MSMCDKILAEFGKEQIASPTLGAGMDTIHMCLDILNYIISIYFLSLEVQIKTRHNYVRGLRTPSQPFTIYI